LAIILSAFTTYSPSKKSREDLSNDSTRSI